VEQPRIGRQWSRWNWRAQGSGSDTRPTLLAGWVPPFTAKMGTPGWQQSTQPICDPWQGSQFAFDIWADARGVFALFSAVDGCPGDFCGSFGVSLKFNAGSGWQTLQEFSPGATGYMGWHLWPSFPGGSLLMSDLSRTRRDSTSWTEATLPSKPSRQI